MILRFVTVLALALLSSLLASKAKASTNDSVVYITCTTSGNSTRNGSGVIVAADGLLLTAKHLVFGSADELPDDTVCEGVIGDSSLPKVQLVLQDYSDRYDAALLKMPRGPGRTFKPLRYCRLDAALLGSEIIVTGFPDQSLARTPSSRSGILATVQRNHLGKIEIDSQTSRGMSGAIVTLRHSESLIGIVLSAKLDYIGMFVATEVLTAEALAREFEHWGLTEAYDTCPPKRLTEEVTWSTGSDPVPLGLREGEGFCSLTRTFGQFDHPLDTVFVELHRDEGYRITGESGGSGPHGGAARCVRF